MPNFYTKYIKKSQMKGFVFTLHTQNALVVKFELSFKGLNLLTSFFAWDFILSQIRHIFAISIVLESFSKSMIKVLCVTSSVSL